MKVIPVKNFAESINETILYMPNRKNNVAVYRMGDKPSAKNDKNNWNLQHIGASHDDSTAEFRIVFLKG